MNLPISTARNYHEATKYSEAGLAAMSRELDWSKQPAAFKSFVTSQRIKMASYLPFSPTPFDEDDTPSDPVDPTTDLGRLSRLLYFTNGVTGVIQYPNAVQALRAAPSAGALYPTEIYVACRGTNDLEPGIYNYQIADHSLVRLWEGDFFNDLKHYCFDHPSISESRFLLILTGLYARSTWRYEERAYRRILLDTGHVLGNITSYAAEENFRACPITDFLDESINQLMFLTPQEEASLHLVALPDLDAPQAAEPIRRAWATEQTPSDEGSTMIDLHRNGYFDSDNTQPAPGIGVVADDLDALYPTSSTLALKKQEVVWSGIAQTIVRRRSTRSFSGGEISADQLGLLLWASYEPLRAAAKPQADQSVGEGMWLSNPADLKTYVAINNIPDVLPGIYFYAPGAHELRAVRIGDFVSDVWHLCMGQELARDASATVFHTADLSATVAKVGNRAYRNLHIDAGHIGQRLNLSAVGMGLGVSGIGGFFDDEVNQLLGLDKSHITVYITTIGQPA